MLTTCSSEKKLIILVLFFVSIQLYLPVVAHTDTQWDTKSRKITAAVLNDFPPLYLLNKQGKPDGIAIDILRYVADQAGLNVDYLVVNNWAEAMQAVRTGKADLIPGIAKDPSTERMAEFVFSHNTETIPVSCFVRKKNESIKGIDSLSGHKVGVIIGGAAERRLNTQGNSSLISCADIDSCLMQLLTGEVEAIVLPEPVLLNKARLASLEDKVKVVGKPLMELQRGFLFRKADSKLLALLDPHIEKFTRSGEFTEIYAKWYGRPTPFWTANRIFWAMCGMLFVSVLLVLFWRYYSINKINKKLTRNIVERKKAEDELRVTQFAVDSSSDAVFLIKPDSGFYYVNKTAAKKLEYSREELLKRTVPDVDPDFSKDVWQEFWQKLSQKKSLQFETRHITKNGKIFPVEVTANYMACGSNEFTCAFVRDITDRKQAEATLAGEKERLAVTLRSIGDGVITTDISGNVVFLNKIAENLTGWSNEEAIGQPLEEVFHIINEQTREVCENPAQKVMNSGQIVGLANHTILVAKDGKELSIADSGAPIRDADSSIIGVVLVFRDVSEQIRTEEELLKIRKLESVGVLAGGIAHDFNNILAAILGNVNLAALDPNLSSGTKKLLAEAEKASLMAKGLTQQLLTFSKGGEPVKEAASLESVIKDSADFVLHGDNVVCRYEIPENLWLVDIDKGQMSQVVQNIVLNASHAMPGGGTIQISCRNIDPLHVEGINLPRDKKFVEVAITDSGIGIPANIIDKIFDPYFSTKQTGSGLGLAISHSIITKHNGHVTVKSNPGVGTTFSLYIPASAYQQEKKTREEDAEGVKGTAKIKIMVMDDEEIVRNVVKSMLSVMGHEVVSAHDGAEALELYREHHDSGAPVDIIIMDLTIPGGMGGKDAVKEVLAFDADAKVIVSSGYSNDPIMANFREYGFCASIVKPCQLQELTRIINQVMAQGQQ